MWESQRRVQEHRPEIKQKVVSRTGYKLKRSPRHIVVKVEGIRFTSKELNLVSSERALLLGSLRKD